MSRINSTQKGKFLKQSLVAMILFFESYAFSQTSSFNRQKKAPASKPRVMQKEDLSGPLKSALSTSDSIELSPLSVSTESISYLGLPADLKHSQNETWYLIGLKRSAKDDGITWAADAGLGFEQFKKKSLVEVSELSAQGNLGRLRFSLGRHRQSWSLLDSQWELGLWQPRFYRDPLRSKEQGFLGLHLEWEGSIQQIGLFASPYFLPSYRVNTERLSTDSVAEDPWQAERQRKVLVNGRPVDLDLSVDLNDSSKLVNNPGAGARYRIGEKWGPFVQVAYAQKPVNEFLLQRSSYLSVNQDRAKLIFKPEVTWHEVQSVDLGWNTEWLHINASHMQDRPQLRSPQDNTSIQSLGALRTWGGQVALDLQSLWNQKMLIGTGYIETQGGEIQDIQSTGYGNNELDELQLSKPRVSFSRMVKTFAEGEVFKRKRHEILHRVAYSYELEQKGNLLSGELKYLYASSLGFNMGVDLIGTEDPAQKGFFSDFRSNDRVYGGMSYVF